MNFFYVGILRTVKQVSPTSLEIFILKHLESLHSPLGVASPKFVIQKLSDERCKFCLFKIVGYYLFLEELIIYDHQELSVLAPPYNVVSIRARSDLKQLLNEFVYALRHFDYI